jgi:2,3-dihydroxybiphenyl 1,2-dioxygenase
VRVFTALEAGRRGVAAGMATSGPCGNQLEFFHGLARADAPFAPGRPISGFRTGRLGMGHAVLNVQRIEDVLPFYRDVLGFRLSDYVTKPFKAYFLHVNPRHHSLALIENPRPGLHHLMVEVQGIDDMGQAYDLAQLEPGRVATTMGRHTNDHMVSFYVRTPSGFMIEYGWGGRDIDPQNWQAVEMHSGPSLWGHERDFLPEDAKAEARRLRLKAAADGERAPLRLARDV